MSTDPNRSATWLLFCVLAIAVAAALWLWVGRYQTMSSVGLPAFIAEARADKPSPYAGQERRRIRALSPDEVDSLLAGKGMGYAKAAELNGYPGPKHVLELAEELALTAEQRQQTEILFASMAAEAKTLGAELVAAEAALDADFRQRQVSSTSLAQSLQAIAALQGRLRQAHLQAHLQQTALLSSEQVQRYSELRGYGSAHAAGHHPHH